MRKQPGEETQGGQAEGEDKGFRAWLLRLLASFVVGGAVYVNLIQAVAPLVKEYEGALGGVLVLFLLAALPTYIGGAFLVIRPTLLPRSLR